MSRSDINWLEIQNNPLTSELQQSIQKLDGLEKDQLAELVAQFRYQLERFGYQDALRSESARQLLIRQGADAEDAMRELMYALHKIADRFVEPSVLLLQDKSLTKDSEREAAYAPKVRGLIEEITVLCQRLRGPFCTDLLSALQLIGSHYEKCVEHWEQASAEKKKELLKPSATLSGDAIGFYKLPQHVARELICRNRHDYTRKRNRFGNHPVAALAGVHYKPNPVGRDYIAPAMEYAIFSFYEMLGGSGLAAPSALIKVDQVWLDKIVMDRAPADAKQKVQETLLSGADIESVLQDDVELASKLDYQPIQVNRVIQAGQTAIGMSLQQLLELWEDYKAFTQCVGETQVVDLLPELTSASYAREFLEKYPPRTTDLVQIVHHLMDPLEPKHRLVDFYNIHIQPEHTLKGKLFTISQTKTPEQILTAFAFLEKWPAMREGRYLGDIVQLVESLKQLTQLFPTCNPDQIHDRIINLMKLLDHKNFSGIVVGSMLTNPSDGKADNYMACFDRDEHGNVISWRIVGIDNDHALDPTFKRDSETGNHFCNVKCLLFFLPAMQQRLHADVAGQLKKINPNVFILEWLVNLYEQARRYQRLQKLSILKNSDMFDADTNEPSLDVPLTFNLESIYELHAKMTRLCTAVREQPDQTLQQLLSTTEARVGEFYAAIQSRTDVRHSPMTGATMVFRGELTNDDVSTQIRQHVTVEKTLEKKLSPEEIADLQQWLEHYDAIDHDSQYNVESIITSYLLALCLDEYTGQEADYWEVLDIIGAKLPFVTDIGLKKKQLNALLHESIRRGLPNVVSLVLRCGANANHEDEVGRNSLWLAANHEVLNLEILEILASHPDVQINTFNEEGTPLLFRVSYKRPEIYKVLMHNGGNPETRDKKTNFTLLDKTMQRDKPDVFCYLVKLGAGVEADPVELLNYTRKYSAMPSHAEAMQEAVLTLMQQNNQFAWLINLEQSLEKGQPNQYEIVGARSGQCCLQLAVAKKLFDNEGNAYKHNNYGRRQVTYVEHKSLKIHFKFYPEMAMVEEAVRLFSHRMFHKSIVPESELFRFTDRSNKAYPVLLSQHVEGVNLQDVLRTGGTRELVDQIDHRSYTELLLLSLSINPEDGKPDNYILSPFMNQKGELAYRLVAIDNDHAFVDPVVYREKHREMQVKTILFCLNNMLKPLDGDVCGLFLKLNPEALMVGWLKDLAVIQKRYDTMFTRADRERLFTEDAVNPILTRIPFQPGMAAQMFEKIQRIQSAITANREITGIELLRKAIPLLGVAYEEAFRQYDTPEGRFRKLFDHQYSTVVADRFGTLVTSMHILQSANIPTSAIVESEDYSVQHGVDEVMHAANEHRTVAVAVDAVRQGKLELFNALMLESSKEAILKEVVVTNLPVPIQKSILTTLETVSLSALLLPDCLTLTTKNIKRILKRSGNLLDLDLSGYDGFVPDILIWIEKNVDAIERLNLGRIPKLAHIKGRKGALVLPNLKRFWVNGCDNLISVNLDTRNLDSLDASDCAKLARIEVLGSQLTQLSLLNTPTVFRIDVLRLVFNSPQLFKRMTYKIDKPIDVGVLSWLLACQPAALITKVSAEAVAPRSVLDVSGTHTDAEHLTEYFERQSKLHTLSWVGCPNLNSEMVVSVFQANQSLRVSSRSDYFQKPKQDNQQQLETEVHCSQAMLDGTLLVGTNKKKVHQISLRDKKVMQQYSRHTDWKVSALAILPNGNFLSGGIDHTIRVWDHMTAECRLVLKGHSDEITALTQVGELVVSAGADRTMMIWNLTVGRSLGAFVGQASIVRSLCPMSRFTFLAGDDKGFLSSWSVMKSTSSNDPIQFLLLHKSRINQVVVVGAAKYATASADHTVKIVRIDAQSHQVVHTLEGHTMSVTALQLLEHDRILASASVDKSVRLWNIRSGECLHTLSGHKSAITSLALLRDASLVSVSNKGELLQWVFPLLSFDANLVKKLDSKVTLEQDAQKIVTLNFTKADDQDELQNILKHFMQFFFGNGYHLNVLSAERQLRVAPDSKHNFDLLYRVIELMCTKLNYQKGHVPWRQAVPHVGKTGLRRSYQGYFDMNRQLQRTGSRGLIAAAARSSASPGSSSPRTLSRSPADTQ